ncbi:MAG: autotransporter domain-containing protein [Sulfuritalea sp.]|nr:autotransporter domain-containing protein [Sulfuritalea sp.]
MDYTLKNDIVIGLAIAWDRSDINLTGTNFGAAGGTMTGRGTTYTPYVGIPINKNWSADMSAGWGQTDVDTNVLRHVGDQWKTTALRSLRACPIVSCSAPTASGC